MFKYAIAGAISLAASLSSANAATETYNFLGDYPGTYADTMQFTSDQGNNVSVTMGTYTHYLSDGTEGGGAVGQWTGYGLGACTDITSTSCGEEHFVDGNGANEFLKFSFDHDVVIESIQFADYGYGGNYFDLLLADMTDVLDLTYSGAGLFQGAIDALGAMFAIGSYWCDTGFKIQSITVSYNGSPSEVPLPGTAWLLLGGLGGLAATKRRKAAA